MESKRIIVLANSIKKGGRCVAGRELNRNSGSVGGWIRPISDVEEGTLMPQHMEVDRNNQLNVLDIVDVPLVQHANDRCHPEDWNVGSAKWQHVHRFTLSEILRLEETPHGLWLEDKTHSDRVSCDFIFGQSCHQSLYLVRPNNFRVRIWKEYNSARGYNQKKSRAVFEFMGVEYNLGLTDPVVTNKYCTRFPKVGESPTEFTLPFADNCLLCVSMTPNLGRYHYKVVATVMELP